MKMSKSLLIFLLCAFYPIFCTNLYAENSLAESSLSRILSNESINAINYWHYDGYSFLVTISSYSKNIDAMQFSGRKLIIYQKINAGFKKIFEHNAALDHFLGMFPLTDNSNRLVVLWISGSSYHFNILRVRESRIGFVLELGSHNFPEFVDIDNDGELEVLVSEGPFLIKRNSEIAYPEKTDIYKWNGQLYALVKTVPWHSRFMTLEKKKEEEVKLK